MAGTVSITSTIQEYIKCCKATYFRLESQIYPSLHHQKPLAEVYIHWLITETQKWSPTFLPLTDLSLCNV